MHDIAYIRAHPEDFDNFMVARGVDKISAEILSLDQKRRLLTTELQSLQEKSNDIAKRMPGKKDAKEIEKLKEESRDIAKKMEDISRNNNKTSEELKSLLSGLPNIHMNDVPIGKDEKDNKEIRKEGNLPTFDFKPREHNNLGKALQMMDFEQTAKISGSRFSTLSGDLALMERALINFMIDIHTKEFGYVEISPPYLVKDEAMYGVGQLPKFADGSFKTDGNHRLIPTAEVPLTNMLREKILKKNDLPIKYVAHTPCFRSESDSTGKDVRGIMRQHQFHKVELVIASLPEKSEENLELMLSHAEEILKRLQLSYRVMLLCSGDTGFSSAKTYDIEIWMPSQNKYREISSCSLFLDFQAIRMKARYKNSDTKKNAFIHTLNGSALAVGRTIIAIMENYQNTNGSISIPQALRPYMQSKEVISLQ